MVHHLVIITELCSALFIAGPVLSQGGETCTGVCNSKGEFLGGDSTQETAAEPRHSDLRTGRIQGICTEAEERNLYVIVAIPY